MKPDVAFFKKLTLKSDCLSSNLISENYCVMILGKLLNICVSWFPLLKNSLSDSNVFDENYDDICENT